MERDRFHRANSIPQTQNPCVVHSHGRILLSLDGPRVGAVSLAGSDEWPSIHSSDKSGSDLHRTFSLLQKGHDQLSLQARNETRICVRDGRPFTLKSKTSK